jgi:hypothetical protein
MFNVVAECDSVTVGGSANMSRDDPQPTIFWDEYAPAVSVQSHCNVILEILTDKLFKTNKQPKNQGFHDMSNTIASWNSEDKYKNEWRYVYKSGTYIKDRNGALAPAPDSPRVLHPAFPTH